MASRVILLGKGDLAVRVAEWFRTREGFDLAGVVPVVPEPAWCGSLISWCRAHGVPFVDSGHFADIPCVDAANWRVDLILSVFYNRILPSWLLRKTRRALNLHNAPLPKYRGVSPINWALKNGERQHGVTIHEITPSVDAGPIVSQVLFDIDPERDEVIDVYQRAIAHGYTLFEQTMPFLERIAPAAQKEADATYFSVRDHRRLGDRCNFTRALSAPPS